MRGPRYFSDVPHAQAKGAPHRILYVLASQGLNLAEPWPGFVLKITPPK